MAGRRRDGDVRRRRTGGARGPAAAGRLRVLDGTARPKAVLREGYGGQGGSGVTGGEENAVVEVLTGGVGALLRLREPGRRGLGFWGGGGVE